MSPRVFDGWTPTEVHEHQVVDDATGAVTVTGFTVVHRESEWDDAARERAIELVEWERGECPCGCGHRASETLGADAAVFDVRKFTCAAERAKAITKRAWEKAHEGQPEGWADGVVHYAVPVDDPRSVEEQEKARSRRRRRGAPRKEDTDG